MIVLKRVLQVLLAIVIAAVIAVVLIVNVRPGTAGYDAIRFPGAADTVVHAPPSLRVTFLGVATLLFDDGETAIMTDGFFTRPGLFRVATRIAPDRARIAESLRQAGVTSLAAVIPVHSHYDHAMDAAIVAELTGATLVGSASSANVGRGGGLPDERIRVAKPGEAMRFGRFEVTLLLSRHVPSPVLMPGEITSPLSPPARTRDYRLGDVYSVIVRHEGRTILVQGSAGFLPGALAGVTADVVYLGVATLARQDEAHREGFWREVVRQTGARRVIAIHWDDFFRPLGKPLVPMPRIMDDFGATMAFLRQRGARDGVDVRVPVEWVAADPFAGLVRRP